MPAEKGAYSWEPDMALDRIVFVEVRNLASMAGSSVAVMGSWVVAGVTAGHPKGWHRRQATLCGSRDGS